MPYKRKDASLQPAPQSSASMSVYMSLKTTRDSDFSLLTDTPVILFGAE